ncbi:flavonol synthase/flavanone 3-hydroxylase-like [Andrographis paniculata]|uniref:flavonol synthase/flavanone 3-hydroxylase-like n=1 Tax=Andrographis paniculata TaxID=175694 RepID=UPI0021E91395|nr:flavonol synthase/flavanone 3-hydroxylase-like [Andrographis paniculata]
MEANTTINFYESEFFNAQTGRFQPVSIPVVQDLARSSTLPESFIRSPGPARPLPPGVFEAVDMARLRDPSGRAEELRRLGRVCKEWSMFLVENHGVDPAVVDALRRVVKGFFDLPFPEKKSSVGTYNNTDNLGYGRNFVKSEDQPLDWIDRLAMKAAPEGATDGLRVWPENPPDFRAAMEEYVIAGRKVLDEVLEALAESISLPKNAFSKSFNLQTSEVNVRVNYYPPSPNPDLTLGITPHSDNSMLTLLIQFDSTNGLQLFKNDQWLTAPWPRNALLVNLGDLIEISSNGRLQSSWHRAASQRHVDRYSVALLYRPGENEVIGNDSGEYGRVVVGDYVRNYYKVSPTPTKETALSFAKFKK